MICLAYNFHLHKFKKNALPTGLNIFHSRDINIFLAAFWPRKKIVSFWSAMPKHVEKIS
jgi:hypothetical protein